MDRKQIFLIGLRELSIIKFERVKERLEINRFSRNYRNGNIGLSADEGPGPWELTTRVRYDINKRH